MADGGIKEMRIAVNKACLMILRNCLARRKITTEATTASLWDQVADLYIKYRKRRCLDCNNVDTDLIPKETGTCYICSDSMCGVCETSIQELLEVVKETRNGQAVGSNMLVEVCSTCRVLGLDKVKSAFKDSRPRI